MNEWKLIVCFMFWPLKQKYLHQFISDYQPARQLVMSLLTRLKDASDEKASVFPQRRLDAFGWCFLSRTSRP